MKEATFVTCVERNSFKLLLILKVESHLLKRALRGKHLRSDFGSKRNLGGVSPLPETKLGIDESPLAKTEQEEDNPFMKCSFLP